MSKGTLGLFGRKWKKGKSSIDAQVCPESQPQLLQIKENPKLYESIPTIKHVQTKSSYNVASANLNQDENTHYEEKRSLEEKFSRVKLEENPTGFDQQKIPPNAGIGRQKQNENHHVWATRNQNNLPSPTNKSTSELLKNHSTPSSPTTTSKKQITSISPDLLNKFINHPEHNSIPFPFSPETYFDVIKAQGSNFRQIVDLPINFTGTGESKRWNLIKQTLHGFKVSCQSNNVIDFSTAIQTVIQAYRPDCSQQSNFYMLSRPDLKSILMKTIPIIVDHALKLLSLLERPMPVLLAQESRTIYLTRKLCCSLLANAFFCTIPESKLEGMPDFNWFRLFNDTQSQRCEVKKEKIKCLLHYFLQVSNTKETDKFQNQIISFERRCNPKRINWDKENSPLCDVKIEPHKKIEDAVGMLQVDFANKVVGGGVLNDGSVMEEIRFTISPELLVSRLFTQALNDDEVLVVTGTEIFSEYTGYSTSFAFVAPKNIQLGGQQTDNFGRTFTQVVAMDACSFRRNESSTQFQQHFIDRELHKANVAFMHGRAAVSPVATGNWGCGAFNGNPELKFFIQWIAASHQGRPLMLYHTIGNQKQSQELDDISTMIKENNVTVASLYKAIIQFSRDAGYQSGSLFRYVRNHFGVGNKKR